MRIGASVYQPERMIGWYEVAFREAKSGRRRVFTLETRGSNLLFVKATRLPPVVRTVPAAVRPVFRARAVRKARRIAGRIRRRLLKVIR